ncbi:PAS domain S-box protein [Sideroxyarcus sp. TK5]
MRQAVEATVALRASERKLSVTLDSIGDAVMSTDAQGRITRLNSVAEQLTGWSQVEALGHPVADIFRIINHKTRQPATIPVEAALAEGIIHGLANDTVLIARDGRETPIADSCAPIRDTDGSVIGAVLVFRDVGNEYAAQQALRTSEERYRMLVDGVKDVANLMLDLQGHVITWNEGAERLKGYTAEEIIGRHFSVFYPAEDIASGKPAAKLSQAMEHGRCEDEGWRVRKDGTRFWANVVITTLYNEEGKALGFSKITRDVSARKAAEDQLDRFFELSLDMMCISSADGYFKRVNPAFTKTLGWSTEEMLTHPYLFFVHPDEHAVTLREVERQVKSGETVLRFENRYRHKDGSWRILSWLSAPDKDGLMYATAHDVTAYREATKQLEAAKQKAELANKAKDSFLATMSHEIRTPLTGMLGMLELLSMTNLDKEQHATLDAAWDSGRGLLRIVSDILDWSKIEEGKLELSPRPTSIPGLLQDVVNTYSRVASAKSLMLWQHADPRLKAAYVVDPLRLTQVLNNFVSNAIKFTLQGEIELRAELVKHLDSSDQVRFSVKDTGMGIALKDQQRLFQRYRQESADTARMYGGTGLGLAICRRLAELLDGDISLQSTPGEGSVFSLTLTLPVSGAPGEEIRSSHLEVEQRKVVPLLDVGADAPLVLAVDDHPINRDLLARQIQLLGLRAETAENGSVALSKWREGRFVLVITDCHMPEMNGYELAREIRKAEADESLPRTPVIAWTANALAEEEGRCRDAGMDELLVKPANLAQLKQVLAKWLSLAQSNGASSMPSVTTTDDHEQPLDHSILDAIVTDGSGHARVLNDFLAHIRDDHAKLPGMLEQGNIADAETTAHRMKGSCRMVGATAMARACEALEQAARDHNEKAAAIAKAALDQALERLASFISEGDNTEGGR